MVFVNLNIALNSGVVCLSTYKLQVDIRTCTLLYKYTVHSTHPPKATRISRSRIASPKEIPIQEEQKLETRWANQRVHRDDSNLGSIDIPFARLLRYATYLLYLLYNVQVHYY